VPGPYNAVVKWMDANMPAGSSVWVIPGWDNYPLMYHAPQFVYAWQLAYPPEPQFMGLDAIQFYGVVAPDYMIAFGPYMADAAGVIERERAAGVDYEAVAHLNRFWVNIHRPDIVHHAFEVPEKFNRNSETIYIFRRRPKERTGAAASFFPGK